jgi:hypothetical protein
MRPSAPLAVDVHCTPVVRTVDEGEPASAIPIFMHECAAWLVSVTTLSRTVCVVPVIVPTVTAVIPASREEQLSLAASADVS